ncbi:MAG: hypothetical protein J6V90_00030 [Treponema sp.]|nr:hypothetical protein [Treponema sp.]
MKKLAIFAVILATALTLASAKKAKKVDPYDDKKMHPTDRAGLDKWLGTNRYDVLDELGIYIKPIVGKIKVKKGNFIYRRGTDVAGFRIYYDTSAYTVEMAEETRKICCDAIDKYCDDFENKRLDKRAKFDKTRRVYGSAPGYEEYGVVVTMMNYKAKPTFYFGYGFVDGSPFFVIYVPKSKNLALEGRSSTDTPNLESIAQNYYFTRAQAQKLKEFICEENISLFHDKEAEKNRDINEAAVEDEYSEASGEIPDKKKKEKKAKKSEPVGEAYDDGEEDLTERDDYTEIKK